jgi:hypothetical protein
MGCPELDGAALDRHITGNWGEDSVGDGCDYHHRDTCTQRRCEECVDGDLYEQDFGPDGDEEYERRREEAMDDE